MAHGKSHESARHPVIPVATILVVSNRFSKSANSVDEWSSSGFLYRIASDDGVGSAVAAGAMAATAVMTPNARSLIERTQNGMIANCNTRIYYFCILVNLQRMAFSFVLCGDFEFIKNGAFEWGHGDFG